MMADDAEYAYPIGMGMIGVLRESDEPVRRRPPMGFGVVTRPEPAGEPDVWALMRGET